MTMQYVRDTYGVPAKRGRSVKVYYRFLGAWKLAKAGRISSASSYIHVDGAPFHPTEGVVYFDDAGAVLLDTRIEAEG
jgi:hypothetical protein